MYEVRGYCAGETLPDILRDAINYGGSNDILSDIIEGGTFFETLEEAKDWIEAQVRKSEEDDEVEKSTKWTEHEDTWTCEVFYYEEDDGDLSDVYRITKVKLAKVG